MGIEDYINDEKALNRRLEESWRYFKICDLCNSLIEYDTWVCLNCKGYRFITDRELVIEASKKVYERFVNYLKDNDSLQFGYSDLDAD